MRVATIDIGTNTTLLLIAEREPGRPLSPLLERATITRLGEGVDRSRRLAPDAVSRTRSCLDEYADLVRAHGVDRVAVVGTSAMRDAAGGESLRAHIRSALGVEVRVLSGEDEARLTFRGALSGLSWEERKEVAVVDIGGGSTEVVIGQSGPTAGSAATLRFAQSFDIGSVRLTERFIRHDPPTTTELDAIRRMARTTFTAVPALDAGSHPVGVAGTVTTLAAVALGVVPYDAGQVHGCEIDREELRAVVERLGLLEVESRRNIPGIEPKRADVIVAGGIIVLTLLEHWDAHTLVVSDRGVRWGLAEELAQDSSE